MYFPVMMLCFQETLLQLLGECVQLGERWLSTAAVSTFQGNAREGEGAGDKGKGKNRGALCPPLKTEN